MSVASQIFEQSAVALGVGHNDDLLLKPMDVAVTGYADDVSGQNLRDVLKVGGQSHTHEVHIRRTELVEANLPATSEDEEANTYDDIALIGSIALDRVYRVLNFIDDPDQPTVVFRCVLA